MYRVLLCCLLLFSFGLACAGEPVDGAQDVPLHERMRQPLSVGFRGTPFLEAIEDLQQRSGIRIGVAPRASEVAERARISFKGENLPLGEILGGLSKLSGLSFELQRDRIVFDIHEGKRDRHDGPPGGRVRVKFPDGTEIEADGLALQTTPRLAAQLIDRLAAADGVLVYKSSKDISAEKIKEAALMVAPNSKIVLNDALELITISGEERDLRRVSAAVNALRYDNQPPPMPFAHPLPPPAPRLHGIPPPPLERAERKRFVAPPLPGEPPRPDGPRPVDAAAREAARMAGDRDRKGDEVERERNKVNKGDKAGAKTPDREFEF